MAMTRRDRLYTCLYCTRPAECCFIAEPIPDTHHAAPLLPRMPQADQRPYTLQAVSTMRQLPRISAWQGVCCR